MAVRVRDFSRAHPSADVNYAPVLARFEERVTTMETLAAQQRDGHIASRASTLRRQELRRRLHEELLRHLVTVAEVAKEEDSAIAERFRLPSVNISNMAYLTAARAMLVQGRAVADLLARHGLAVGLLEDLATAVGEYDAAVGEWNAARSGHIAARADLRLVSDEIMRLVGLLDGLNRYRYGSDAAQLAAWESARNVVGPVRGAQGGEPVVPQPEVGEVKPAA